MSRFVEYLRSARLSESKLDEFYLQSEIQINYYDLRQRDLNRNSRGTACYIRIEISCIQKLLLHLKLKKL